MRIQEDQKHTDPKDLDSNPEHCYLSSCFLLHLMVVKNLRAATVNI
jgi:hypothetical protein